MLTKILLISFLVLAACAGSSPSLSGYYSYSELTDKMGELLITYSEIIIESPDVSGLRFESTISMTNKPKILIIGGLYGGYPIDAYQVLHILESLAKAYVSNDTAVIKATDSVIIDFLPVLNKDAYLESEANFNDTGIFQVIYTDLKNETICPNNSWAGTNLDRNFPDYWTSNNDKCSNDYSGTGPLSSSALNWVYDRKAPDFYDFIINFQGDGNYYAYPHAYEYLDHSAFKEYIYERVLSAIPSDYSGGQLINITETSLGGTLLDSLGADNFVIQVAIGASGTLIVETEIEAEVDKHYKVVLSEIISRYSQVSAYFVKSEESLCEDVNCTYYSNITVEFEIINNSTISHQISFEVDLTFNNGSVFDLYDLICSELKIYDNSSYDVPSSKLNNGLKISSEELNAVSSINIQLYYTRYNKTDNNNSFTYQGTFTNEDVNLVGEPFSGIKEIGVNDNTDDDNDDIDDDGDDEVSESTRNGLIIGLILGFAFLILVIIVVCVLCKRKKAQNNNQA